MKTKVYRVYECQQCSIEDPCTLLVSGDSDIDPDTCVYQKIYGHLNAIWVLTPYQITKQTTLTVSEE